MAAPQITRRGLNARVFAAAAGLYRRALRGISAALPAGSEQDAVELFETLQEEAYRTGGWRSVCRCWLSELGAIARLRAAASSRQPQGTTVMSSLRYDLRDAWRTLRRAPGYSVTVMLMLALGIGANTAVFSVVDALLFQALPYADADRLTLVAEWPRTGGNFTAAPSTFLYWRTSVRSFSQLEARAAGSVAFDTGGDVEEIRGAAVTPGYFDLLGVIPASGRTFTGADAQPNGACVTVISHRLWARRPGGNDTAIGQPIRLNGQPCTLIGVLPMGSVFDRGAPEVFTPLAFSAAAAQSNGRALTVIGRLKPGVSIDQASRELADLTATFNATRGPAGRSWTTRVTPWRDVIVRTDSRQMVWMLFGAVGLVLAIACVNVAGLSLSRTTVRERELAVRAALGAGRTRLFRALVTESLLLAAAGGVVALAIGTWALRAFVALVPAGTLPVEVVPALNGRALLFTMAACVATGVIAGVLPAWHAGRSTLTEALAAGGRGGSGSRRTSWTQSALVVVELALAMVLVCGASLLGVSFVKLIGVRPGFDAGHVLTFRVTAPASRYGSDGATAAFFTRVRDAVRAVPSVQAAGAATSLPLGGWLFGTRFTVEGAPADPERPASAHIQHATSGYFEALRMTMASGRTFADADDARAPLVAIVNETFARRFLTDGPALGRRLHLGPLQPGGPDPPREIVGVLADVKTTNLADAALATPEIYVPHPQASAPAVYFAVRTGQPDMGRLALDIRAAVRSVDPAVPVGDVMPMQDRLAVSIRANRFRTLMIGMFAVLAAMLSCLGAYAVRARAVASRTREIGVRLALGSTQGAVVRLALGQGMRLAAIGLTIGLGASVLLGSVIRQWLFDTRPTDPIVIASAVAALGGAAALASWIPARRAAAVDPLTALREG